MPRQIRLRSLRTKIIAWSFVPATLVLFAVALVAFYAYQHVAQDLVVERNQELARLSAGQLADELAEYSARLVEWAQTAGSSARDRLAQQAALQQASNQLAVFDGGVVVLDGEGMVVAAGPERPDILGQDWSNRLYFRQAALIRRPVFSDVVHDGSGHSPAIVVAVPILGNQGELQGVVAGVFRLGATAISSLYGSIVKLHIGGNDMAYLVDGDGQVIYHGDPDMIGHDFSAESAVAQVLARDAGAFRTHNWAGREIVASFAPVPGTSWGLVIEADWNALLRSSQGYRPLLLGLLALGVILPTIVVAVGVRRITRPIGDLIGAAQQVASGNFGQTVSASTGDEIEELVTQFNSMSAQLAESYSTLRAREERLALVLQGTNDGIWDWNLDTDEVYYSPRWKSMLGYQEHEIDNRFEAWRNLLHPDDAERAMARVQAELAGTAPAYELEHRLRHKDGAYRWILARGRALRDASGTAYRMVGSHTDITQRKRAEEELRRQNEYLAALHETTLGMISRLDIAELLEAIVERAVHLVGATYGFVYLVRPETDEIEVSVGTGPYREYVGQRLNRGEGLSGIIWQLGQPLAVDDYQAWPDHSHQFDGVPFGPALGTPLMSGADVVGVIGVARLPSASPFRQDEVDLITRFSHLASIALDNAHLHTSLQQELAERVRAEEALQALVEFEDAIARISSSFVNLAPEQVDGGIQRALQTIGKAYNVERAYVFQFSADRTRMDCTHEWCTDGIEPQLHRMKDVPITAWRWTAEQIMRFEVVQIRDGSELPPDAGAERAELQSLGLRSRIVVPMVYLGAPVGFVGLDARRARHWTEQSLKLQVIGDIFVNALEHKRAQQALQEAYQTMEQRVDERTRELSTLLEVSKNMVSRLELEPLLGSILDELKNVVEYEGCMVFALEADELVPLAHRGRTPQEQAMRVRFRVDNPLDRLVLRGREPVIVSDTQAQSATAWAYHRSIEEITETTFTHIRSWLGVPLVVKDQVIGALALDHSQPDHFSPAHARLVMAFANQAAAAVENARLFRAEQERREEAERRRQVAEGMREILAMLNSRQSLQETLDFIASQTCRLLSSNAAAILRLQDGLLRIQAACGLEADYIAGVTMRLGEGGAGRALSTRQPIIIADLAQAAQHTPQQDIPSEPQKSLIERLYREYRSILSVPLIVQGRDYGAITAYYPGPRVFSEEDLALAMSVADQVALAIENARLSEQAGQAAAMEERGRLARELHDSVTQSIYGVTMYTEAAARLVTAGQETTAAEYLRDARDTAQEALREMRLLIYQLRPPLLEKGGLPVALQVRLDAVERRGGIHAELIVEGQDRLPPPIQAELHQIAQEALNNALKHAHAQRVQVRLRFGEDETSLQVRDDGAGFEPDAVGKGGGLGIPGIKERVQKIGGRLRIESAPGLGTDITVQVPTGGGE